MTACATRRRHQRKEAQCLYQYCAGHWAVWHVLCRHQHLVEGTASPGHIRTSPISIFITFLNRSRQVVCITIYIKLVIIKKETNRQSSTGSNVGLVPWGHAEPRSDADDVFLLLE